MKNLSDVPKRSVPPHLQDMMVMSKDMEYTIEKEFLFQVENRLKEEYRKVYDKEFKKDGKKEKRLEHILKKIVFVKLLSDGLDHYHGRAGIHELKIHEFKSGSTRDMVSRSSVINTNIEEGSR